MVVKQIGVNARDRQDLITNRGVKDSEGGRTLRCPPDLFIGSMIINGNK